MAWRGRPRRGRRAGSAGARAAGWAFPASGRRGVAGSRSASRPPRSGWTTRARMLRHGRLARAVAGASLAEIRRQPAYETLRCGPRPVEASHSFPSSRTSSRCGTVKGHLPSWERTFRCDAGRLALDRDEDAARTLAASWPPSPGVARRREPWTGWKSLRQAGGPGGSGKPMSQRRVGPAPPPGNGWMSEEISLVSATACWPRTDPRRLAERHPGIHYRGRLELVRNIRLHGS
jgi:hypothetical protein